MSRHQYLGYGHYVTKKGLVDNSLQTQLSGHFASARPVVEEPLVAPEMFPSQDPVCNTEAPLVAPEMYPDNKPVTNDNNVLPIPVMTWD